MKKLPKNFLCPFCICVFSYFEKIFLKSTQHFYKLYWNWINFTIINAEFSQKISKNIPKILFKIYFKSPVNFIQNLSKILKIFFFNFCNIHSQKFSWNLYKFFQKFPQKFSQNLDKILLIVYPKFPKNFILLVDFPHISISISSHLNIFTIN